ncbi:hypothetical protein KUCAC02_021577, partial [Chaenocephalus aceratus]
SSSVFWYDEPLSQHELFVQFVWKRLKHVQSSQSLFPPATTHLSEAEFETPDADSCRTIAAGGGEHLHPLPSAQWKSTRVFQVKDCLTQGGGLTSSPCTRSERRSPLTGQARERLSTQTEECWRKKMPTKKKWRKTKTGMQEQHICMGVVYAVVSRH